MDQRLVARQRLELVGGRGERQAGIGGNFSGDCFGKSRRGIEAGADRCAALCEQAHAMLDGRFDPAAAAIELVRVA